MFIRLLFQVTFYSKVKDLFNLADYLFFTHCEVWQFFFFGKIAEHVITGWSFFSQENSYYFGVYWFFLNTKSAQKSCKTLGKTGGADGEKIRRK